MTHVASPVPSAPPATERTVAKKSPNIQTSETSVGERSLIFADALASQFAIENPYAVAFINPLSCEEIDERLADVREHISSFLAKSFTEDSIRSSRFDTHQRLVNGLTCALGWVYQNTEWMDKPLFESLTLQAFVPLYIVPPNEPWENRLPRTLAKLRRLVTLKFLCDSLNDSDVLTWLNEEPQKSQHPQLAILRAFRLCLKQTSDAFWNNQVPAANLVPTSVQLELNAAEVASWKIALQLNKRSTQILPSVGTAMAHVSWNEVIGHWERLKELFVAALGQSPRPFATLFDANADTSPGKKPAIASVHLSVSSEPAAAPKQRPIEETAAALNSLPILSISSASDSAFRNRVQEQLEQTQSGQATLSLAVIRTTSEHSLPGIDSQETSLDWKQAIVQSLRRSTELDRLPAFATNKGELTLLFQDVDRSDLASQIRDSFEEIQGLLDGIASPSEEGIPLVAGISSVHAPSRNFQADQLVEGAWRCLDAAAVQGVHAVKSIQVY